MRKLNGMNAVVIVGIFSLTCIAGAQELTRRDAPPVQETASPASTNIEHAVPGKLVVPAGTKVPLSLKSAISTKTARPGDSVYAQTTFPVAIDNRMLIPPGTYVQGRIMSVKRPGRIKGRAEILFHFTTLVFPNGYTVSLPGAVDQTDSDTSRVNDPEGTIQHEGQKGKDAATIGRTAVQGAAIGAIATQGAKGAGIGGGIGGAAGLGIAMLTRGDDVRLEAGTSVEMVLQRDLLLDEARVR